MKNCVACICEFEEAIHAQDEKGLFFATTKEEPFDGRKHFFLFMVDDKGKIMIRG